ncbi:MAG TPA: energy transducer TonB [Pyrinomonadaceae bacterium]|jgi:TonB family protein|nr:energy transducer TonB [Pyrinomonadaceae bacterium]
MRTVRLIASLALIVQASLFSLPVARPAAAAQTAPADWKRVAPEDEEFTVLMPEAPQIETEKEPVGQVTLTTTYYTLTSAEGLLYFITSVGGMETLTASMSDKERLATYSQGFWGGFLKGIRDRGMRAEKTYLRDLKLNGYPGEANEIIMGDLSGLAHVYATRRKFYAVMIFNAAKGDPGIERFLGSFTLAQPKGIPVAEGTPAARSSGEAGVGVPPVPGIVVEEPPPPAPTPARPLAASPINGGVLNGKALSLPKPSYPAEARAAKAGGTVTVRVLIDENGEVIRAEAVSGHPLLHSAAVEAARQAKFSPTKLVGQPVKVTGVLVYNFIAQ